MKQITTFLLLIMLLMTNSVKVSAQVIDQNPNSSNFGQIVWLGTTLDEAVTYCNNGGYVYLYNVDQDKFLTAGGAYGVHAVLSSVGMRLKITRSTDGTGYTTCYTVMGRVDNQAQGSYMSPNGTGNDIYMDRKGEQTSGAQYSQPNWYFTVSQGNTTVNGTRYTTYSYTIRNYNRGTSTYTNYLGTNTNNTDVIFVGNSGNNRSWRIITEEDYKQAMDNVTWGEVDLGSFVKDAEFGRDDMDGRYWVWGTDGEGGAPETGEDAEGQTYTKDGYVLTGDNIHWHQRNQDVMCNGYELAGTTITPAIAGTNVLTRNTDHDGFRNSCAKYYAAEIYNEVNSLKQELEMTGVQNLNAGLYRLTVQALYYDDADGLTNDGVSYLTVEVNTDGVVSKQELPIIPMNKISNNITPHSGVSAGYVFDNNSGAYQLDFFIELKSNSKLKIGIETRKAEGWTVIGNIHLYAHGKQVIFIDEDWSEIETLTFHENGQDVTVTDDPYNIVGFYSTNFTYPVTINYQRTMTKGAWNTICLPISLTGSQIRTVFGSDCILSSFKGLDDDGTCILFEDVDLDLEGLVAGKPYIIKPTRDPDVAAGETEVQEVMNGGQNHTVSVEGPTYYVTGVTNTERITNFDNLSLITHDSESGITFEGNIYKKVICNDETTLAQENWVITKGDMYHLTNTKAYTVWGTYAYLHAPLGSLEDTGLIVKRNDLSDQLTAIEGLRINASSLLKDNTVYTITGQKVATDDSLGALPSGVYIMNGKKFLVK